MTRDRLLQAIDALGATGPATPADVRGLLRAVAFSVPAPGLGVVREKSVLRTRIDTMFEDNTVGEITPAVARDVLEDMVDSLLDTEAVLPGARYHRQPVRWRRHDRGRWRRCGHGAALVRPDRRGPAERRRADGDDYGPGRVAAVPVRGLHDHPERAESGRPMTWRYKSTATCRGCGRWSTSEAMRSTARDMDPAALYELLAHASRKQSSTG